MEWGFIVVVAKHPSGGLTVGLRCYLNLSGWGNGWHHLPDQAVRLAKNFPGKGEGT